MAIKSKNDISLSNLLAKDENGKMSLENFKGAIDKIINNYRDKTIQHDAIEFISHILEILSDELDSGIDHYPNIINSTFKLSFISKSTCCRCGKVNSLVESDLILKLNLELNENDDNNCTLAKCLQSFEKEEELIKSCDNNECEFHNKNTNATKQIQICSLPDSILVHLKRTSQNHDITVSFPIEDFIIGDLLHKFSNKKDNAKYSLVSVINYLGVFVDNNQGHYYTYCRDQLYGTWWELNDGHMKQLEDKEDIFSNKAVLLVYVKSEMLPKIKEVKHRTPRSQVKSI